MRDLEHLARLAHDMMLRTYGYDTAAIRVLAWEQQPTNVVAAWKAAAGAILTEVEQSEANLKAALEMQQRELAALHRAVRPVLEFVSRCQPPRCYRLEPDGAAIAITNGQVMGSCLTLGNLRQIAALVGGVNPEAPSVPAPAVELKVPGAEFPGNGPVPPGETLDPAKEEKK